MTNEASAFPPTAKRVEQNTAPEVNGGRQREMMGRLARLQGSGSAAAAGRLDELDREWDIERTLQANMAVVLLTGLTLGATVNKKWYLFSGAVAGFFLQHALQGWCPPVVPWRRAGVRTMTEIEDEKTALRVMQGELQSTRDPAQATRQVFEQAARARTSTGERNNDENH